MERQMPGVTVAPPMISPMTR